MEHKVGQLGFPKMRLFVLKDYIFSMIKFGFQRSHREKVNIELLLYKKFSKLSWVFYKVLEG